MAAREEFCPGPAGVKARFGRIRPRAILTPGMPAYAARMKALLFAPALLLVLAAAPALAQQEPDTTFNVGVARPAFTARHPRVSIDQAHHEFHTMGGRYGPFARLMKSDGLDVIPGRDKFNAQALTGIDILVIANALGVDDMADTAAAHPAFTGEEIEAVRTWVEAGGALLLIADHSPMGSAAKSLAAAFGVDMRSSLAVDPVQGKKGNEAVVTYVAGKGLFTDHPIVHGRDSTETLHRVTAFAGQSLTGPPHSAQLLQLSDRAEDLMVGLGEYDHVKKEQRLSAKGRAQAIAFDYGHGRVVVLGEAAMLSAQVAGPRRIPMGMNVRGNDDRQFALNVMRWLGRAL